MGISATEPIGLAMSRTGRMLFKPFDIGKWFVLGFAAFLAHLAEGGAGNLNANPFGGGPGPGPRASTFPEFLRELGRMAVANAHWLIPVAFVGLVLWIALLWVRARGKLIFLDGVARNHAAIIEPWSRLRREANSFFRFDLALSLIVMLAMVMIAALSYLIGLPDLRANVLGPAGITALAVGGAMLVGVLLGYLLAFAIAEDFLIPLMYLRAGEMGGAWAEFRAHVLPGNVAAIALFYVLRVAFGMAAAAIVLFGTCLTCCIAGLPYLSSVFFLPIFVFTRAYGLYFLAQCGPGYQALSEIMPQHVMAFPVIVHPAAPVTAAPLPPPLPPQSPSPQSPPEAG